MLHLRQLHGVVFLMLHRVLVSGQSLRYSSSIEAILGVDVDIGCELLECRGQRTISELGRVFLCDCLSDVDQSISKKCSKSAIAMLVRRIISISFGKSLLPTAKLTILSTLRL